MFNLAHLNNLRAMEIQKIIEYLRPGARILEIGAGTGQQARELAHRGFRVEAIETPSSQPSSSQYAQARVFPIVDYNGVDIPFPDLSFDVVFSSNVLEHVPDLARLHAEIRRVLKHDGYALHVLPTHSWRFWTLVSTLPTALQYAKAMKVDLLPRLPLTGTKYERLRRSWCHLGEYLRESLSRHGERGSILSEIWYFHPSWWRRNFRDNGFEILKDEPMGLFYTGNMTFGSRWRFERRQRLARIVGSACHIFQVRAGRSLEAGSSLALSSKLG